MKFRNQFLKYKLHMNTNGNGGGGGSTVTVEDLQKQLAAVNDSLAKIESKKTELLNENKTLKESMKNWEGLDAAQVRNLIEKVNGDEELKLITEGKYEDVIKKRTEKVEAGFKAQLNTAQTELEKYKGEYEKANSTIKKLLVDTAITTEFVKLKGVESAVPDVVFRAQSVWHIENGEPIPRDKNGEIMQGKNGVMTMPEWIETLRQTAPHLFPESASAGPTGNNGQNSNGIDAKISAARRAGNLTEVRRLKELKAKGQNK